MDPLATSIDWQSLGAFGIVLVVLVLLVSWTVKQFIKHLERRETTVLAREEKLLQVMDKQADAIEVHTKTMQSIQENLKLDRESITKQIKRAEANIKRVINGKNK